MFSYFRREIPACNVYGRTMARATMESVGVVSLTNLHFFAGQAESESSTADRTEVTDADHPSGSTIQSY